MTISKKTVAAIVISAILAKKSRLRKQKKRTWIRDFIRKRETENITHNFLQEMRDDNSGLFQQFFQISSSEFDDLLNKIRPLITKKDTNMRKAISPETKLMITLRYLLTGDSYRSLMLLFRVPHNTISGIVPLTCKAIFHSLRTEYLKVR